MANSISDLKAFIRNYIKENHREQITGPVLQNVLIKIVDDLPSFSTEDCVKVIEQVLTEDEKEQARENINAGEDKYEDYYDKAETDDLLAAKQNTISDLTAIREGAALGATSLQSIPDSYATKSYVEGSVSGKQDVISDLATIRSGAALGATSLQSIPDSYAQKTYVDNAVSAKQNIISDLADIRSGAALGATAIQSIPDSYAQKSYVDNGLNAKQNTISDLADIRSGAALGATSLQSIPDTYAQKSYVDSAVGAKQDTINDLATIRSGAALGATALQSVPSTYALKTYVDSAVGAKQDALSTTQMTAVNSGIDSTKVAQIATNAQGIVDVNERIDNLSISGRYLSIWNCVTGLPTSEPTSMPYAYKTGDYFIVGETGTTNYIPDDSVYSSTSAVKIYTSTINTNDHLRYDGSTWEVLNLPQKSVSFSSISGVWSDNESLAGAINSKANASALSGYYTKGEADTLLAAKQATISDLSTIRSGAALGATALQSVPDAYAQKSYVDTAVGAKQDTISDLASIRSGAALGATSLQSIPDTYASKSYVDTAVGSKQDTISDLSTIRSGAQLGATALQSVPDTYALKTYVDSAVEGKQNTINDLETIRSGAALGATALQSIPDTYAQKTWVANYFGQKVKLVSNEEVSDLLSIINLIDSGAVGAVYTSSVSGAINIIETASIAGNYVQLTDYSTTPSTTAFITAYSVGGTTIVASGVKLFELDAVNNKITRLADFNYLTNGYRIQKVTSIPSTPDANTIYFITE